MYYAEHFEPASVRKWYHRRWTASQFFWGLQRYGASAKPQVIRTKPASRISAPNPQNQPLQINFIPFHLKSARPKLIRPQEPNSKSYIKFTTCWFEHIWTPEKMRCLGLLCHPFYCADKETSVSDPFLAVHPMGNSTVKHFRAKHKRNFDQMKIPSWTQTDFTPNSPTARFCCMSWVLKP